MLRSIEEELTDEDFEKLNLLCGLPIPVSHLDTVKRPRRERFCYVTHCCDSSDENKNRLSSLLFHIGRLDLRNRLLGVKGRPLTLGLSDLTGAPNDGFLPNALKRCFRLSGVLLKLCRLILGCAINFLSVRFF